MKELKDIEEKISELIKEANENKDWKKINQLGSIARDIDQVKKEIKKIQDAIDRIEKPNSMIGGQKFVESVSWEVTNGAIKQNYLITTKARKAGLLPPTGQQFEVETSCGQIFQTDELPNYNRLRERGKISEFYEKVGIRAGDKVIWTEIGPNRYYLEKS